MREKTRKIVNKAVQIISSKYFFWGIITLFVFQALWITFSFRYPMLFDEYYHFGLIKHFSHQWLPWITNQSTNLDQYGALGRDPYLLYHYLMSFPFRIVDIFTNNLAVQVISMRLINVTLFAGGIVSFWHLLKEMDIKKIFRNVSLLFLVLLPVTSFVAATINYDSAVFLLTAIFMLIGVKIVKNQKIQWHHYALFILIGMIGSMMKSSFLPIFAAGFIFIIIRLFINHRERLVHNSVQSFKASNVWLKVFILIPIVVVGFLFTERFAVNVIKYHSLSPSCTTQMSKARCLANPIEARNDNLAKNKKGIPVQTPSYTSTWFNNMIYSLLYTGSNTDEGAKIGQPLPVVYIVIFIGFMISIAAFFYGFIVFKKLSGFWLLISIISLYSIALFYVSISAYYTYYVPIAIQGRYLLPLLPVLMVFALLGINHAMQKRRLLKLFALVFVLIISLSGAGVITHIMRSDDSWYWGNQTVHEVNNRARDFLSPLVQQWWYDRE